MLRDRAVPLGIVGASDRRRLGERHIGDSLRAVGCLPGGPQELADLGSGAGLPGIPVAIARPDCTVTLVEARRARAAFLELAVERLGLSNVRVLAARAEEAGIHVDGCLARALARPARVWRLAGRVLRPDGYLLYFAGRDLAEVTDSAYRIKGTEARICVPEMFAWQGPVVIMRRTSSPPPSEVSDGTRP